MTKAYEQFTSRNAGYVSEALQAKIANARVLIAGCGIGSQVAEAAARLGFQHFVLIDADTIDVHNLNRQSFFADQIGQFKANALKANILRINPAAQIETRLELLSTSNAKEVVQKSDLIFDTIDFLDLKAIVALHDEAHLQKKILISSFSVGFGAAVMTFAPNGEPHSWIREIFNLTSSGDIGSVSYVERYIKLFTKIASGLDPQVLAVMQNVFQQFAEGKVCPAPQVSPGAHAVAALCTTAALRALDHAAITVAPQMLVMNMSAILQGDGFVLAGRS